MAPFRQNLSNVTTQGGQQGIVGRGGNFQPLGAHAQGLLQRANAATVGGGQPVNVGGAAPPPAPGDVTGVMPPSDSQNPVTMPPSATQPQVGTLTPGGNGDSFPITPYNQPPKAPWQPSPGDPMVEQAAAQSAASLGRGMMVPDSYTMPGANPQQARIAQRLQTLQSQVPQEPYQNPGGPPPAFGQMPPQGGPAAGVAGAGMPPRPPAPPGIGGAGSAFDQVMANRAAGQPPKPVGQQTKPQGPRNLSDVFRGGAMQPKPPSDVRGQPPGAPGVGFRKPQTAY